MTLFMSNPDEYKGGEFDLELFDPEKKPIYDLKVDQRKNKFRIRN